MLLEFVVICEVALESGYQIDNVSGATIASVRTMWREFSLVSWLEVCNVQPVVIVHGRVTLAAAYLTFYFIFC